MNIRAWCVSFSVALVLIVQQLGFGAAGTLEAQTASNLVSVSLSGALNNTGIGSASRAANFDGAGDAYSSSIVPPGTPLLLGGVPFQWAGGARDNVVALGQTIPLQRGTYTSAYLLVASSWGATLGQVTVHYVDGSSTQAPLYAPDWTQTHETPVLSSSGRLGPHGPEDVEAGMFVEQIWMDPTRIAEAITLPRTRLPKPHVSTMHVFALTLVPSTRGDSMTLLEGRSTDKQTSHGAQIVEATLENTGTVDHDSHTPLTVTVEGPGITSVAPALVTRLPVGEEVPVEVGVSFASGVATGSAIQANLVVRSGTRVLAMEPVTVTAGISPFLPTEESLARHEAPDWYDGAKFGIFIHYGLYSIPAWAPVGGVYAEWYWRSMEQKGSPTYQHQLRSYGPRFQYDDFIPRFTATRFDPRAWVELFKQAGARYFVMVSKHHDGFALFRTRYSNRNSVEMGPHRDLVGALMDAARKYTPEIHRGLYYSLPEWYNPSYGGMPGKGGNFAGGPPHNYVTGQVIPYTGYVPVTSYVHDLQAPQMRELIDQYRPDILWCDIGGDNDSLHVLAHFYNDALASGRQVAVNSRCGIAAHDFTTPEYKPYAMIVQGKWEMSRGMDPHSYGYNANTPVSAYASAGSLVRVLADVVSKNGNLLLDIGPRGDGSIPGVMLDRLRAIGSWLKVNGEAIYDTAAWWRTPSDGNLRFTLRPNHAFYIISLTRPGDRLVVHAPVPVLPGDHVTLLGWRGQYLHWTRTRSSFTIAVPRAAQRSGQYAWVFKVS